MVTTAAVFELDRILLSLPFYYPKFILGMEGHLNVIPFSALHYGRIKLKTFKWASIESLLEFLSDLSECKAVRGFQIIHKQTLKYADYTRRFR